MSSSPAEEISIKTRHLTFAAKRWGRKEGLPVLALHGWLDNAASFDRLAPCLPELQIVALDLAGHGHSDHRPAGIKYHFVDYIDDIIAVTDALGWRRFALLGHSMGAGISGIVGGCFPDLVSHLILLEGLGPMSREADQAAEFMSRAVMQMKHHGERSMPVYPDMKKAIAARAKVGDMLPESAQILVRRNLKDVEGGFMWRSDPRLKLGSAIYMTEDQVQGFLSRIEAPTLLCRAENGLFRGNEERINRRINWLRNCKLAVLAGGHHLHLDDPAPVAETIREFLQEVG